MIKEKKPHSRGYLKKDLIEIQKNALKYLEDNDKAVMLYEALKSLGVFDYKYSRMVKKFNSDKLVQQLSSEIKRTLEGRLVKKSLGNSYNASFAKFLLINHYGYTDKQEINSKISGEVGVVMLPTKKK